MSSSVTPNSEGFDANSKPSRWKRNLLGVVISIVCIGYIASQTDIAQISSALKHFRWAYLVAGFCSLSLGYAFRIVRWAMLLRSAGAAVRSSKCIAPFLASIALNNVLPMRSGDIMRALVFPASIGVGRLTATGTLIMERLIDVFTLVCCFAVGFLATSHVSLPTWLVPTALTLGVTASVGLSTLFLFSGSLAQKISSANFAKTATIKKAVDAAVGLLRSFQSMSRPRRLLSVFAISGLVWAAEAGLFWALLIGFRFHAGPLTALMAMSMATLATLIPSSPGYVGPFHLAAFASIQLAGGTVTQGASFAVLSHLAVWAPTTLAGGLAILFNPDLFGRVARINNHGKGRAPNV